MKVILDTNVFISGVFFGGAPFRILQAWRDGKVQLVLSPEILAEILRVSEHLRCKYPDVNLGPFLALVAVHSQICNAPQITERVCDDPEDDKFIACALASSTSIIVTGDKHLLKASGYRGVKMMSPRAFCDRYLT